MSTSTLTLGTATKNSTSAISQSSRPTSSSSGVGTPSSTTTATTPTEPQIQETSRPPTPTSTAPTSLPSRPSTPPTPTTTSKQPTNSKKLKCLPHISIATWVGVGITLAGLVVAVYYGIPMLRLAIWTARNDFREACRSDLEAALPQTAACNETLRQPPLPPPVRKRMVLVVHEHSRWGTRFVGVMVFGTVLLLVLRRLVRWSRTDLEQPEAQTKALERLFQHVLTEQEQADARLRLLASPFSNAPLHEAREKVGLLPGVSNAAKCLQGCEAEFRSELEPELMNTAEPNGSQEKTGGSAVQALPSHETLEMASTLIQDVRISRPPSEDVIPLESVTATKEQIKNRETSPGRGTFAWGADAALSTTEKSKDASEVQIPAVAGGKQEPSLIASTPEPLLESSREWIRGPEEVVRRWKSLVASARRGTYEHGWRARGGSSANCNLPLAAPGSPPSVMRLSKNLKRVFVVAEVIAAGLLSLFMYPLCVAKIHELLDITRLDMLLGKLRLLMFFTPIIGVPACYLSSKTWQIQAMLVVYLTGLVITFIVSPRELVPRITAIVEFFTVLSSIAAACWTKATRRGPFAATAAYCAVLTIFITIFGG